MATGEPPKIEPVHLVQDANTGDRFLVYETERGIKAELRYEGEALWMTQAQMAGLFRVTIPTINVHLRNVYAEGELNESPTIRNFLIVQIEGARNVTREIKHYNLDAVISVGYRVSSKQGTLFRKWATEKLVQFATTGFVIDIERLKEPGSDDRFAELREIIRDIRSDEANVYRELRAICAMCQDYNGDSDTCRDFYQHTQAKFMWAIASHTPSEIIARRADANSPNMGLQTWPKDRIRKQDAEIAKNYLTAPEIKELNRLTTILLDIFEDQLDIGRLTMMADAETLLNQQLQFLGRPVLKSGGKISSVKAKKHAAKQYAAFDAERKRRRHAEADAAIAELKSQQKTLGKSNRQSKRKPD